MRLDIRCFALAGGVADALTFTLCALAVAVAPVATTEFLSFVVHYELTDQVRLLTPANFVGGLLAWGTGTAAFMALLAWLYNLAVSRRELVIAPLLGARQS